MALRKRTWNKVNKTDVLHHKVSMTVVSLSPPPALQVNPPYYVKLVELVPHPETAAAVVETTHELMTKVKINT